MFLAPSIGPVRWFSVVMAVADPVSSEGGVAGVGDMDVGGHPFPHVAASEARPGHVLPPPAPHHSPSCAHERKLVRPPSFAVRRLGPRLPLCDPSMDAIAAGFLWHWGASCSTTRHCSPTTCSSTALALPPTPQPSIRSVET